VARLRARGPGARAAASLRGWLAARWRWLAPRWIPVGVAGLGLLAMLGATSYLRRLATAGPALIEGAPASVHDVRARAAGGEERPAVHTCSGLGPHAGEQRDSATPAWLAR
jgi:hypothetical protein